jgi:4-azaleucine resistance transporter AzlC
MKRKAFRAAFPYTIPIFAGFWFLGLAYGIYMHACGFSFVYPMVMSLVIFGGSLEFVAVQMLLSPFAPASVLLVTLMVQARHLFYGLSMLDVYKNTGWKKFYLIFGMCDETFSILYTAKIPEDVDRGWFMFFVTLLNHFYWVSGATIGGLAGSLLTIDTTGISFVMTAMFTVIFMEQWKKDKSHTPAYIGLAASAICLVLFQADSFLIPSMIVITASLITLRSRLDPAYQKKNLQEPDLEKNAEGAFSKEDVYVSD